MNGKRAKQIRKVSLLQWVTEVKPIMEKAIDAEDLSKEQKQEVINLLPTPRQVYQKLKRAYYASR